MRAFSEYYDEYLQCERLKDFRFFRLIDFLPTAMGRRNELEAGEIFPLLKSLPQAESDDDEDPREVFSGVKAMFSHR